MPDDRQLELYDILRDALPDDAFLRYDVAPGTFEAVEVATGSAAAWTSWHAFRGARWLTAIAQDPDDASDVARAVELAMRLAGSAADDSFTGITVPRGGLELLPSKLRPPVVDEWDWWVTESPPVRTGRSGPWSGATGASHTSAPAAQQDVLGGSPGAMREVLDLQPSDPRIAALLAVASPDAPIPAGDPRVVRWAALLDSGDDLADTGGLAALVAVTLQGSGAAHLNDVATHPERRRRGLAREICGTVTCDAFDEGRPAVTLGMYAHNDPARAVYSALGFSCTRRNTSGALPR